MLTLGLSYSMHGPHKNKSKPTDSWGMWGYIVGKKQTWNLENWQKLPFKQYPDLPRKVNYSKLFIYIYIYVYTYIILVNVVGFTPINDTLKTICHWCDLCGSMKHHSHLRGSKRNIFAEATVPPDWNNMRQVSLLISRVLFIMGNNTILKSPHIKKNTWVY